MLVLGSMRTAPLEQGFNWDENFSDLRGGGGHGWKVRRTPTAGRWEIMVAHFTREEKNRGSSRLRLEESPHTQHACAC